MRSPSSATRFGLPFWRPFSANWATGPQNRCSAVESPERKRMSMDVDAEFHRGEVAAISAQHLFDQDAAGEAMTTMNSWWKHLTCERCGHTFRRGDRVHVDPRQQVVHHLDPGIGCGAAEKAAEPPEV